MSRDNRRQEDEGRWHGWFDDALETGLSWWDNRPSMAQSLAVVVFVGGAVVGIGDKVGGWELGHTMAETKVDPSESWLEQNFDSVVHEIGKLAVDFEGDS